MSSTGSIQSKFAPLPMTPPRTRSVSESSVLDKSSKAPTPPKSEAPKGMRARSLSVRSMEQLTSPEVPKKVSSKSGSLPSPQIQENAQEHAPLLSTLTTSEDSVSVSPKHFREIESMAREGKSALEIAKVLQDPSHDGYERYSNLSENELEDLVKTTPQFDRGSLISERKGKGGYKPLRADVRLQRDVDSVDREIHELSEEIKKTKVGTEKLKLNQKLKQLKIQRADKQLKLEKFLESRERLGPAPKQSDMLKNPNNIFQKLYSEGTAKHRESLEELGDLKDARDGLERRLRHAQSQLSKSEHLSGQTLSPEIKEKSRTLKALKGNFERGKVGLMLDSSGRDKLQRQIRALERELAPHKPFLVMHDKVVELQGELDLVNGEIDEIESHLGMQWDSVKTEFLSSDRREFFMSSMTDFRMQFIDMTVHEVIRDLKFQELETLKGQLTELEEADEVDPEAVEAKKAEIRVARESWDNVSLRAVGSTDLTSDYDMTILADRPGMDTAVMKEVNRRIQSVYGIEAGSVFDTNLYVKGGAGPDVAHELVHGPKEWASTEARQLHDEGMDIAALVKQRKYSSQSEWDDFTSKLSSQLTTKLQQKVPQLSQHVISQRVETQMQRFADADAMFKKVDTAIKEKMVELKKQPEHASKDRFDLELTAMNRLFEEASEKADKLKQTWQVLEPGPEKDLAWAAYTRADTEAQFFANEPYFSEGPIRDVVINGQKLKGLETVPDDGVPKILARPKTKGEVLQHIEITPIQALQSLTENYGDSMKEFEHLKKKPLGEIAIKASKYMGRLARAIQAGIPEDQRTESLKSTLSKLQGAEVELLRIRKGGQIPPEFVSSSPETRSHEYGMKILADHGLGEITELDDLVQVFKDLKLEAEVIIRSGLE